MDPEGTVLSEVSQTERQILYDFTYLWNQKKQNKQIIPNRHKLMNTEIKLMVARVEGDGEMGEKGEGK